MNLQESIIYLSQVNSRKCHPMRKEEVQTNIPYFEIKKNDLGRYTIDSYGYKGHDNEPRMELWEQYMKQSIFPNIDPTINISGFYNIELHDSYTYLNNDKKYKNVLCFSKYKNDPDSILVPDPYMICNFGGMLNNINDDQEWDKKKDKIVFCGTTTGNRDPFKNERINMCLWSLDKRDWTDFYITKVAQMELNDINSKIPNFKDIYRKPISIDDQIKYRYHLAMDGNTCRFDVWYYKTNNVIMKYDSKEMLWYYPLLQNDVHFLDVNKDNMKQKMEFYSANPQLAHVMIFNAKKSASMLFRPITHQMYTINLFESIANNK